MNASRLLGPFLRKEWPALVGATASTLLLTVAGLASPWPLKIVLNSILDRHPVRPFVLQPSDLRLLAAVAGLVLAVALVDAVSSYLRDMWLQSAGERIVHDLRVALYAQLQRLSLSFHERQHTGDLVTRITGDVNDVGTLFSRSLGTLASAVLLLIGMLVVTVALDPLLALASFAVAPLLAVVTYRYRNRVKQMARRRRAQEGQIATIASEALGAMRVVKAFGSEGFEQNRVTRQSKERLESGIAATRIGARFSGLIDILGAFATALVLVLGVFRVAAGVLSPGDLVVLLSYTRRIYRPLREIASEAVQVAKSMASGDRIAEILATDPMLVDRPGAYHGERAGGNIVFENVSFAYAPRRPALTNLSLAIPAGSRIAVVGRSGAGKSTLGALVARFYDPDRGRVLIDGRDARDCSVAWVREQIGLVLQDTILFSGTVTENISYGIDASPEAIVAAATTAGAGAFISALPDGYETALGPKGVGLSGGQRQRIAIARTLLRNPPILVLDEPTTGLDAESEARVMEGLAMLMQGRTTILISHSLGLALSADRIVVLDQGRVVQEGTPSELLAVEGPFRSLAADQGLVAHESAETAMAGSQPEPRSGNGYVHRRNGSAAANERAVGHGPATAAHQPSAIVRGQGEEQ